MTKLSLSDNKRACTCISTGTVQLKTMPASHTKLALLHSMYTTTLFKRSSARSCFFFLIQCTKLTSLCPGTVLAKDAGTTKSWIEWLMIAYTVLFSLCSHVILHQMTSFLHSELLNIHRSGVLTALAWLVPHETAAISAHVLCTPYNHAPCHFLQSHTCKVYACLAVACHLHFWQNDRGSFTCYCSNMWAEDTEIKVSTESWPWRRKFSHHSCRNSNPRPFSQESGALTTELSSPPG